MLGILVEDGYPVQPMEVMYTETSDLEDYGDNAVALEGLRAAGAKEVIPGNRCDNSRRTGLISVPLVERWGVRITAHTQSISPGLQYSAA